MMGPCGLPQADRSNYIWVLTTTTANFWCILCMEGLSNLFRTYDRSPDMAKSISEKSITLICDSAHHYLAKLVAFHLTLLGVKGRTDTVIL